MSDRDDHDLRDRFQRLRREDVAGATPFRATLAAAARRWASPRPRALRIAAAAAVIAALGAASRSTSPGRGGRRRAISCSGSRVPSCCAPCRSWAG